MITRRILIAAIPALIATPASAHGYKLGDLAIGHPWTRPTRGQTGAGYMKIGNSGTTPDRLTGGKSPAAEAVQIHEMHMDRGVMRMREIEGGFAIPAGATVEMKPGGVHLMLFGLKQPFELKQRVPLTLVFERSGTIDVELVVQMGEQTPAHDH
jgi:copper(I)-binding protein